MRILKCPVEIPEACKYCTNDDNEMKQHIIDVHKASEGEADGYMRYLWEKEAYGERKITTNKETINHPQHYGGDTTYEAIKVIEAWQLDFCLGNTVKYISRAGKKDPVKELEDLEKAKWYLERRIIQLKSKPRNTLLSI